MRLVTAQASVPAVLGLFAGLTAAFNTNRLLSHLLFATTPHDVQAIGAVVLGVLFTAVIAAYLPARRVMAVDPVATLRAEEAL